MAATCSASRTGTRARSCASAAEIVGNLETLRSATTVAADILQPAGKLGVIRPGAIADLLVVKGNPLEDIGVLIGQGERSPPS